MDGKDVVRALVAWLVHDCVWPQEPGMNAMLVHATSVAWQEDEQAAEERIGDMMEIVLMERDRL